MSDQNTNTENCENEEKVTEEMIRARAYQLFEEKICQEGHAEYDWQQAESDVLSEQTGNVDS